MSDCIHTRATGRYCEACETNRIQQRIEKLEFELTTIREIIAFHPGQPDEHHGARPVTQRQYDELRDDLETMTNLVYSWKRTADHYKAKLQEQINLATRSTQQLCSNFDCRLPHGHKGFCLRASQKPEGSTRKAKPKKRSRSSQSEPKTLPCGCDGPTCIDDKENK